MNPHHASSVRPLISVHIPKTGGVSFRNILRSRFGTGYVQMYWDVITDCTGQVLEEIPAQATCVHGHFVASDLQARLPGCPLVTWVRDPVDRVASSYHYMLRSPDWQNSLCRELHERKLGLLEYAELTFARNEMARFLGTVPIHDFDFVGLMEDYAGSLSRFAARYGTGPLPVLSDNTNPAHGPGEGYPLSRPERKRILELNALDAENFEDCLELLDVRRRKSA